jgi:hypothetical protein
MRPDQQGSEDLSEESSSCLLTLASRSLSTETTFLCKASFSCREGEGER